MTPTGTTNRSAPTSASAKLLYRPVGMVSGLLAGVIAGAIFDRVYKKATHGDADVDPPGALESEYSVKEILAAAAVQGAIFAVVKAVIQRSGARAFERATGEWPGS